VGSKSKSIAASMSIPASGMRAIFALALSIPLVEGAAAPVPAPAAAATGSWAAPLTGTGAAVTPESGLFFDWSLCGVAYKSFLDGQGPDAGEHSIRFSNVVKTADGTYVDLVVTADTAYVPNNAGLNGLSLLNDLSGKTCFGAVNMQAGDSSADFLVGFYETGTNTSIKLSSFYFTMYDLDSNAGSTPTKEQITFNGPVDKVFLATNHELEQTGQMTGGLTFTSTVAGNGADNPTDPWSLTPQQEARAVTVLMSDTNQFSITLSVLGGNANRGRQFLMAGTSSLVHPDVSYCCDGRPFGYIVATTPEGITTYNFTAERTAACVFNSLQVVTYLAQAGNAIDEATRSCHKDGIHNPTWEKKGEVQCWVDVTTVIESFGFATAFLAAAVNQCGMNMNLDDQCASDIAGTVAAVADMMQAAAGMSMDCPDGKDFHGTPKPIIVPNNPGPNYKTRDHMSELQKEWSGEVAQCTIDAFEATFFLARAGINIDAAVQVCPPNNKFISNFTLLGEGMCEPGSYRQGSATTCEACAQECSGDGQCQGFSFEYTLPAPDNSGSCKIHTNQVTGVNPAFTSVGCYQREVLSDHPEFCATSVTGVIYSFSYVAAYIAGAAAQCEHGMMPKAACASDVARLVGSLAFAASAGSSMLNSCVRGGKEPGEEVGQVIPAGTNTQRRMLEVTGDFAEKFFATHPEQRKTNDVLV